MKNQPLKPWIKGNESITPNNFFSNALPNLEYGAWISLDIAVELYKANTMTISGATIINIEITFSSTSYMGADFVAAPGTYVTADKIGTWTGSATSVVFTNGTTSSENVQARMKKIVVTYK